MLLSHDKKFIFIHVYKTAGTSVRQQFLPYCRPLDRLVYDYPVSRKLVVGMNKVFSLQNDGNRKFTGFHKHEAASVVKEKLGAGLWDDYYSFAFVRNPFDWLTSLYFYIRQSPSHLHHAKANSFDFSDWLQWYIHEHGFQRQSKYVADENGVVLVNKLGRFERLEDDLEEISLKLGIPFEKVQHKNASRQKKRDFRSYYSDADRELVEQKYATDLNLFGYHFDAPKTKEV